MYIFAFVTPKTKKMEMKNTTIGLDLGGTNLRAGRIANGVLEEKHTCPTPKAAKNEEETLLLLENLIRSVWNDQVTAIGIGVPSVVDRAKGVVYNVANIPHWEEVHLKARLEKTFGVPCHIDNDANCFALGERIFGQGREVDNFVGLTLGTGLGGGIIQQGKILADANCGAGEFGALPYRDKTLEYYCSGSYFRNVWNIDGQEMYARAQQGNDPEALEAYRQLGEYIGAAIKIVVLTIDPEMIIFGGSVASAHPLFEAGMRNSLLDFDYPNSIKRLQIRYSTLADSGIMGAASLCY